METRLIGSLRVSLVGLRCNNFGKRLDFAQTDAVVQAALRAGSRSSIRADIYEGTRSEEYAGRPLG